jgi:hypothetical protein
VVEISGFYKHILEVASDEINFVVALQRVVRLCLYVSEFMIMIEIKITNPIKLPELIEKTGRIFICSIRFAVLKRHWCFEQSFSFRSSGYTDSGEDYTDSGEDYTDSLEVQQKNCDGHVCSLGIKTSNCMPQKLAFWLNKRLSLNKHLEDTHTHTHTLM